MSKNAQIRNQLNIRFTGEDKAELLQNLEAYLSKYKITKADFVATCIQNGIDADLASVSPTTQTDHEKIQNLIEDAVKPLQQQLQELNERLGEWRKGIGRKNTGKK